MPAPVGRPKTIKTKKLNFKQRMFVEKLFELGDPLKAYKAAGYGGKGKSADTYAWMLLKNLNIKHEIDRRLDLINIRVKTRLRNMTDLALDKLQAIIEDKEERLSFNKRTKQYDTRLQHMGATPGVRRQAIADLLSWVGIESAPMKIDSKIKNETLADFIRARKLLAKNRGTSPAKEKDE